MAVSMAGKSIPTEVMGHILSYCPPGDNIHNARLVCKEWHGIGTLVAKMQWIDETLGNIDDKAASFLRMVPEKLGIYCPSYAKLEDMRANIENFSIQEIYHAARATTEKDTVCIAKFFRVNPNCSNIPDAKRNDLAGKAFAELHFTVEEKCSTEEGQGTMQRVCAFWSERKGYYLSNSISFFPIELFGLTLQDENHTVRGNKDDGSVCFALHGRLIELTIEKGSEESHQDNYIGISQMNRNTAHTINLTAQNSSTGYIWPSNTYVARLDAHALSQTEGSAEQ